MSIFSREFIFLYATLLLYVSGQMCNNPTVRQEWRQLSESQRQAYLTAVKALKARPFNGDENADMSTWNHDMFSTIHWKYQQNNHGKPAFFPWHRKYIDGYESALRSIDPSVSLPYWDWRLDSQNPGGSILFQARYFGGDGDPSTHCVTNGVSGGWNISSGPNSGNCLRRCNSWQILHAPEAVARLLSLATDFNRMSTAIEGGPHAAVHNQMGCDFSSMASSSDAIFFPHHAMVDKLWWIWQQSCSDFSQLGPGAVNYPPFGQQSLHSTTSNGFCYSYSKSAADVPFTIDCPSGQVDPWGGPLPNVTNTPEKNSSTVSITISWLENAIIALVPIHSAPSGPIVPSGPAVPSGAVVLSDPVIPSDLVSRPKGKKSSANRMSQLSVMSLRKRDNIGVTPAAEADDDFCYRWTNIKCSVLPADDYLAMMQMSPEQIKIIHEMHDQSCAAVQEINANPYRNSVAALESFAHYNPSYVPPKQC